MNANQGEPRNNERYDGYRIKREIELPDIEAVFIELEHIVTGARHVHIQNQDRENTFGVVFKTIPKDSTGVAHILEHTVLCGSQKFPVRDPFFSMLKRSLSTFMNALTASDWTMYPFSTQNRKDYFNLMNVYLDSVFNPRIDELSFKQEGHRLEIVTDPKKADAQHLEYKGVVYNEMKGAMSSPDQVMARSLLQALYPATTYRFNSGGEPAAIPRLSHDQLKAFHRHHYHPSNSYFYTYGNIPLVDSLDFINENYLGCFSRIQPDTDVPPQPRWENPQQATFFYPMAKTEDPARKCQVALAWLTADVSDTFQVLALTLLEQILLGNPGSPLRKALIDSQLGTTLCDASGFEGDNRDTMFVCGLKGVEASAAEKIESLVLDVFRKLVQEGIDAQLIESAIHQLEFHRKEITSSPYPYGIKQLLIIVGNWIHGGDPLKKLQFNDDLERIRKELGQGRFFENLIARHFLDNPHRVLFKLLPDQEMDDKERQQVKAELVRIKNRLDAVAMEKIRSDALHLARLQETVEDLSCLPTLKREDIPEEVQRVNVTSQPDAIPLSCYAQKTSGIFYLTAAVGIGSMDSVRLPLVPFFCFALPKIGTLKRDYTEMVQRIDRYTGGVSLSPQARMAYDPIGTCIPFIAFNAKSLNRNCERMFDIVREMMIQADFSDLVRLKNLLMEYRANLESMVVSNGHRLAISLAARNFSLSRNLSEIWSGITQLSAIKRITDALDERRLQSLSEELSGMRDALFVRQRVKMALIGDSAALPGAETGARTLFDSFNEAGDTEGASAPQAFGPPLFDLPADYPREGWHTSSAVSFVAQTFNTVRMEHADAPALAVIAKLLRSLYLHREIREKGGAYGGFALYNAEDGLFCYASYRDPHIINTLNVYRGAVDFIKSGNFNDQDIDEAILQVCSEIDKPDPPGPAARKAFYRNIVGLSDAARLRFKKRLLNLTRQQVFEVARTHFHRSQSDHGVAVISGENQLLEANHSLDPPLAIHPI